MTEKILDINEVKVRNFIKNHKSSIVNGEEEELVYSYEKNVIIMYKRRPLWFDPTVLGDLELAKISYVKSKNIYKL